MRFRNTLLAFSICTVFTLPVLYEYYVNYTNYVHMLFLLGSTYPPHLLGLFTSMFVHYSFTHYFFNMMTLWLIGPYFEDRYGSGIFWVTYVASGIAASLSPALYYAINEEVVVVLGSSGALFGIIGFIIASPHRMVIISNPVNIIMIVFLLTPLAGIQGIAYLGHLLGFLTGLLLGAVISRRRDPYYG